MLYYLPGYAIFFLNISFNLCDGLFSSSYILCNLASLGQKLDGEIQVESDKTLSSLKEIQDFLRLSSPIYERMVLLRCSMGLGHSSLRQVNLSCHWRLWDCYILVACSLGLVRARETARPTLVSLRDYSRIISTTATPIALADLRSWSEMLTPSSASTAVASLLGPDSAITIFTMAT